MARGELADESQGDCEWVSESEGKWAGGCGARAQDAGDAREGRKQARLRFRFRKWDAGGDMGTWG